MSVELTSTCTRETETHSLPHRAGIAKGPGNLIYQASTLAGLVRVWEAQPDHTLKEKDVIKASS